MRYFLSIWLLITVSVSYSQERWVSVVDGWMAFKTFEKDDGYYSFGLNSQSPLRHTHQFNSLDLEGNLNSSWQFYIDTTYATSNFNPRAIAQHSNKSSFYSASFIRMNESFRYKGVLFKYKSDFSDTITVFSFPYGDSGGLRTFHEKEPNKLIVLGTYQLFTDYKVRARLFEIDTLGTIAWQQEYMCGGDCWMSPYQITPLPDGGYFYTNEEIHYRPGTYDIDRIRATLIRTDATGNQVWRKYYGSTSFNNQRPHIVPTDDGNYLFFWTELLTSGWPNGVNDNSSLHVAKIDIDGNVLWEKNYYNELLPYKHPISNRQYFYLSDVAKLSDGSVVLYGAVYSYHNYAFIMKILQDGTLVWHRQHVVIADNDVQDSGLTNGYGLTLTSDGGFILAGEYFSGQPSTMFPQPIQTGVVIKLDEYGCLEENCHLLSTPSISPPKAGGLSIFPNPTSGVMEIVSDEVMERIEVTDLTGKVILNYELQTQNYKLDISQFAEGVYYLKVTYQNNTTAYKKIVKE